MTNSRPQSGFAGLSNPRFQHALQQALPLLEMLVEMACINKSDNFNIENSLPCAKCLKKETCKEPCEILEAILPAKYQGVGYKEKNVGISFEKFEDVDTEQADSYKEPKSTFNRNKLKTKKIIRLTDIYGDYKKCWYILTDKQRKIITLRYRDGMTQKQIAQKTGKKRSSVSDILKRAKDTKEKYEQKLRAEKFNLLRNKDTE